MGAGMAPGLTQRGAIWRGVAFPTVAAVADTANGTTPLAVNIPARTAGDRVLVILGADASIDTQTWSLAALDGSAFTLLGSTYETSSISQSFTVIAPSTESASTVTATGTASKVVSTQAYVISGAHATRIGRAAVAASGNPPSLTPSWGSAENLWFATVIGRNGNAWATAAPTGYGNLRIVGDHSSGLADYAPVSVCYRQLEAASDDPTAFTLNNTAVGGAATLAVGPA